MDGAILKSSIIASMFSALVLVAALTASGLAPVATEVGEKGDVLVASAYHECSEGKCDSPENALGGYKTTVERDVDHGLLTLTRMRVGTAN